MSEAGEIHETWVTLIQGAAAGKHDDRSLFSHRYLPVIRAYIAARWRNTPQIQHLDDAVQEVFVECFRDHGALSGYDPDQKGGFRAFLFGVVRNVALRFERNAARKQGREQNPDSSHLVNIPSGDDNLATVFDRAWATTIMAQAKDRMQQLAMVKGAAFRRRYEILRLRFEEELPIREIASRWQEDPATVHREYRRSREEFRQNLRQVVAYHAAGAPEDLDRECARLLGLLAKA